MRTNIGIAALAVLMALLLVPTMASAQIAGSVHDMSQFTDGAATPVVLLDSTTTSICTACHFPHNVTGTAAAPLSNRNTPTGTFTMYSSATIDEVIAAQPNASSLFCLSCHDGATAVNSWIQSPSGAAATTIGNLGAGGLTPAGNGNIGLDLSDDHPISITYTNADGGFLATPNAALDLKSGQVECATCHEPHDTTTAVKFLRIQPATICEGCHTK